MKHVGLHRKTCSGVWSLHFNKILNPHHIVSFQHFQTLSIGILPLNIGIKELIFFLGGGVSEFVLYTLSAKHLSPTVFKYFSGTFNEVQ